MFVCHNILIHLNSGSLLSLFPYYQNEVSRAIELREIVTSLGPAYIKLGQALSIRPDILSPAAMTELQKLCDKVRSSPFCFVIYTTCNYFLLIYLWCSSLWGISLEWVGNLFVICLVCMIVIFWTRDCCHLFLEYFDQLPSMVVIYVTWLEHGLLQFMEHIWGWDNLCILNIKLKG